MPGDKDALASRSPSIRATPRLHGTDAGNRHLDFRLALGATHLSVLKRPPRLVGSAWHPSATRSGARTGLKRPWDSWRAGYAPLFECLRVATGNGLHTTLLRFEPA